MEEKKKVLLIDDDDEIRETYAEVFKDNGYLVIEAIDGVEGLDIATKQNPDIIFTGIVMPRMDGFALMEALQKNVITAKIPVMISSHLGREIDQQKANQLGAKEFIIRDTVTPREAVEKASLIINKGGSYNLKFDPQSLDAIRLAQDLKVKEGYQCLECSEQLILNLKVQESKDIVFDARFVCPGCGWEAK